MDIIQPVVVASKEDLVGIAGQDRDSLILIVSSLDSIIGSSTLASFVSHITSFYAIDPSAKTQVTVIPATGAPGNRVIVSPVTSLIGDTDDVRRYGEAAGKALAKAKAIGSKRPFVMADNPLAGSSSYSGAQSARLKLLYRNYLQVVCLGLLNECYVPLQARETLSGNATAIESIKLRVSNKSHLESISGLVRWTLCVDAGRVVAKDIGGADPERMAPLKCAEYIASEFKDLSSVKCDIVTDVEAIKKEYPLLHAVARCSLVVPRHRPAVVLLSYVAADQSKVAENIYLVGKGVTYDTGGADLKVNGVMRGMSRDKCGGATVAGFMKTVGLLKPSNVNVYAWIGFVRNSVGSDSYVSDEILTSRAGARVLVGNTDAEGRMVMTDLLAQAKEKAIENSSKPSRLFTVATLTGHAVLAVGEGYSISLDNGPGREDLVSQRLFNAGHDFGDPFETSTLRREDYEMIRSNEPTQDVYQANDLPSSRTPRGHQYPAAFMVIASGLDKHGLDSKLPLCYTHVDIAPSAECKPSGLGLPKVTGAPIVAFAAAFLDH